MAAPESASGGSGPLRDPEAGASASTEEFERALLAPQAETLIVPAGRREQLDFAVLAQIFREPLREAPSSIHDLARIAGTDRGWRDAMPKLYSFLALARFERPSLRQREQLFVAMADGITWDGQPIPGLPPGDASFLAMLTGDHPAAAGP